MEIKHVEKGGRGGFVVRDQDGKRVAELTYVTAGDSAFIIDHTEVDPDLRGQGVAEKLLDAAANYARENNLKITQPARSHLVSCRTRKSLRMCSAADQKLYLIVANCEYPVFFP